MASLSCSFSAYSKKNCSISKRYPGVKEFFSLTSCKTDIRSHLRTRKVSQTTLTTKGDFILARTGHFREDRATMTICPSDRAEIRTFFMCGLAVENVRTLCMEMERQRNRIKLRSCC